MVSFLIETANSAGDRWVAWMTAAMIDSAALLAVTSFIWLAIRRRATPHVGYCLFLFVPLKLLVPVSLTVPATIACWTPSVLASAWTSSDHVGEGAGKRSHIEKPLSAVQKDNFPSLESQPVLTPQRKFAGKPSPQQVLSAGSPAMPEIALTPNPATRTPRFSIAAIAAILWMIGVLLLLGQLIRTQIRFRAFWSHCPGLDSTGLGIDLPELCRSAGITQTVQIFEHDCVATPAVWGLLRPTIILPRGIMTSLTSHQLRWVLLHELAHIGRRDLFIVVLQRLAAILHFFNPCVWIANHFAHRLREYVCDDLAISHSSGSGIEPGEAFLKILRHANRNPRGLQGALGMFGLDSRTICVQRVRRLLDFERPIRTRTNSWSVVGLLVLSVIALPHLRAGGDEAPAKPPVIVNQTDVSHTSPSNEATDEKLARDTGEFELTVTGLDGKAVPAAAVEIRTHPHPTAEQIRQGTFMKQGSYGTFAATDTHGRLVVKLPKIPGHFDVSITTPGFEPYWAGWSSESHSQPIPARFTAALDVAWSVGGIIVDDQGNPVPGVEIRPSIRFKKRPGDLANLGLGDRLKSDAAGKWHFDSVPASMTEVHAEMTHPDFKPLRRPLSRSEFGLAPGTEPGCKIVLDRGLVVTGKVTDDAGTPLVGALVRTKFVNDLREARTGEDGVYRLVGCESRIARIVVSAKGRATDMQEVQVVPQMEPVNFHLPAGGTVRLHALDEQGRPVPRARIFFQQWRGRFSYFEFNHVSQYANENGVWEWNEAPLDEFKADICRPDGMELAEQPLIARQEPYLFRIPPALVINGSVTDAETGQPIKKFQVVPGVRFNKTHVHFDPREQFGVTDGKFRIRHTHDRIAHLVRIEAEGYLPGVSRDIKSHEGNITIDFALRKGNDIAARILTPQGQPAARAQIALGVNGSQISIRNGEIRQDSTYCAQQMANDSGDFRFPPQASAFQLVIFHPSGFAFVKGTPESFPENIQLEPWARVEGTFRIGNNPAANITLTVNHLGRNFHDENGPSIHWDDYIKSGPHGEFAFNRVVPGRSRIGRRLVVVEDEGAREAISACMLAAEFPAGETTRLEIGGTGQRVIGRLQPPRNFRGPVRWNFAMVNLRNASAPLPNLDPPPIPAEIERDPTKKAEWFLKWQLTDAGKIWLARKSASDANDRLQEISPRFTATVDQYGTFQIDDVPAGNYSLQAWFSRDAAGVILDAPLTVLPADRNRSDVPVDLGTLTLESRD